MLGFDAFGMPEHLPLHPLGNTFLSKTKPMTNIQYTYQDDGSASESWTPDVEPAEVLKVMEREAPGWHPAVAAIMRTAPKGTIIHWKLMWRDLCESWTSPAGRVVQVGDSAHSFLPSSGNGASQAMEDAITLATCLQLGGKSNISSATKVYNNLRLVLNPAFWSTMFSDILDLFWVTDMVKITDTSASPARRKCLS